MRIKVQSCANPSCAPDSNDTIEVVDVETGKLIQGITSLFMDCNAKGNRLQIEFFDFDVDIEADAEMVPQVSKRGGCHGEC